MREFTDPDYKDAKASRYFDLEGSEIDDDAKGLLENLKSRSIPAHLNDKNVHKFSTKWCEGGMEAAGEEQKVKHDNGNIILSTVF